ncbi:hypothetical protein A7P92_05805 [Eikenella corrodens]|uniref:DUF5906 domain-containing protein n=1 Tax=Eikenella corrodens TaxID=539 RepID=UPI0007D090E8|nr:DUF5906 domain-containing protein [Eikenella corrodens]OAM23980.1 hypothetical protein A7P92_05805 [Eikenella corrodens]
MSQSIDFATISSAALSSVDNLLAEWLPSGRYDGHEFVALNPTRADKKLGSFRINTRSGQWADFATGDKGGDLIDLYAYLNSCNAAQAARSIAERLSLGGFAPVQKVALDGGNAAKPGKNARWQPIVPVPPYALRTMNFRHSFRQGEQAEPVFTSVFRDAAGQVLGAVARFIKSDGSKIDLPYTFCENLDTHEKMWRWRGWQGLRPLYGLDALAADPERPVLVVEGEKCKNAADAAQLGYVVITWHGGAGNWDKTDWSAVQNRRVILWPDCDSQREKLTAAERKAGTDAESKPYLDKYAQPGMAAMLGIAERLTAQGCKVAFVRTPEPGVWPPGYDIADALADRGQIIDALAALSWQHLADYTAESAEVLAAAQASGCLKQAAPPPAPATEGEPPEDEARENTGGGGENMPETPEGESRYQENFDRLKREFSLIEGKSRAVSRKTGVEYSRKALVDHFCKKSVDNWFNWGRAPVMTQYEVNKLKRDRAAFQVAQDNDLKDMMARYVYLDGSSSIWDNQLWRMIDQGSAKLAMGSQFKIWQDSPARIVKRFDRVVFEPGRDLSDEYINIYRGLPLADKVQFPCPREEMPTWWLDVLDLYPGCRAIQKLIAHLCNHDLQMMEFVYNWLAYPLQHPGAKLTTSLVMHGDVHGAGKSLLFEEIIKPMYGDYAATLGQSDLESNYTGNRSGKLFIVFEEVFNTKQKYDQTGAMKHMITGKTMRIERKFVDSYEEANHINCVFLSNEAQPFKIEENDRRYFVIWPKNRLPESLRAELEEELGADGVLQFFMLLLSLPLTINYTRQPADDPTQPDVVVEIEAENAPRFDPHTKPPMTEAKANVINYGRYGWQTFFHELENGEIARGDIVIPPNAAARTDDMVRLYRWWCRVNNEREISRSKFLQHIASKRPRRKSWVRGYQGSSTARQFWVFLCPNAPLLRGEAEQDALGRQLFEFERAVDDITRAESV